jgi:hypothetical protein
MRDAISKNPDLSQTETFIAWACGEGKEIL